MRAPIASLLASLIWLAGCGDDAAPIDLTFTGGYEDWDTAIQFRGIVDATVTHVDSGVTATTAPNGRSTLELTDVRVSDVTYEKDGYLPARYTLDPAAYLGPYDVLGISTTRVETFHDDLGLTWDPSRALVELSVISYPSGDRVDGVSIAIGGAEGGVHQDGAGAWLPGATTDGGPFVVYPNVPITGGGEVTIGVLTDRTCHAPATLHVVAGEVAMTTIACDDL
jgi:hypothetical protein